MGRQRSHHFQGPWLWAQPVMLENAPGRRREVSHQPSPPKRGGGPWRGEDTASPGPRPGRGGDSPLSLRSSVVGNPGETPPVSVSRQEKTGPWGVNSQEPLQVQTKPAEPPALGNQGRPRAAQGRPPFLLSASWAPGPSLVWGIGARPGRAIWTWTALGRAQAWWGWLREGSRL